MRELWFDQFLTPHPLRGLPCRETVVQSCVLLLFQCGCGDCRGECYDCDKSRMPVASVAARRSEEHTSELQSRGHLVCRLLLEKQDKNNRQRQRIQLEA